MCCQLAVPQPYWMFCTQKLYFQASVYMFLHLLAPFCPEAEPQLGLRPNSWSTGIMSWGRELSKDLEKIYFALRWDSETHWRGFVTKETGCFCYAAFTGVNTISSVVVITEPGQGKNPFVSRLNKTLRWRWAAKRVCCGFRVVVVVLSTPKNT